MDYTTAPPADTRPERSSLIPPALAALALLLTTCGGPANIPQQETILKLEVGEPFPSIVLPSLDGAPSSIRQFRGQKVLLHVFASW